MIFFFQKNARYFQSFAFQFCLTWSQFLILKRKKMVKIREEVFEDKKEVGKDVETSWGWAAPSSDKIELDTHKVKLDTR